jgi:hypothetical protein
MSKAPRLFVNLKDISTLMECNTVTASRYKSKIAKKLALEPEEKLNIDHVCKYFKLTNEQISRRLPEFAVIKVENNPPSPHV